MYLATSWHHCLIVWFNFKGAWFTINFSNLYHWFVSYRFYSNCVIYLLNGVKNSVEQGFYLTESEFNLFKILITCKSLRTCLYLECYYTSWRLTLSSLLSLNFSFVILWLLSTRGVFLVIIGKYYSLVGYFFSLTLNIEGQFLYTDLRRPIFY